MSSLLSGLEGLGLGSFSEAKVYEEKKPEEAKNAVNKPVEQEIKEIDLIFDKTYKCPICEKEFKAKQVKGGKIKRVGSDTDLRPRYNIIDIVKYDAIVCPACGFSAINSFFAAPLSVVQRKLIKENISSSFRGIKEKDDVLSYEDAIVRYKLALVNTIVKKGRLSEKAYTCLKMAWVLRGQAENLPEDTTDRDKVIAGLKEQETECLSNAYEGFTEAFSKESFPMCGMDDTTVTYLCAVLAKEIGKYEEAIRLLSTVITSKNAKEPVKDKAREIKDEIKALTGKE